MGPVGAGSVCSVCMWRVIFSVGCPSLLLPQAIIRASVETAWTGTGPDCRYQSLDSRQISSVLTTQPVASEGSSIQV